MQKLKLHDLNFYSDYSSSKFHKPKFFEWDRSGGKSDLVFFTDLCFNMAKIPLYKRATKVAWLLEPVAISPDVYKYVSANHEDFDIVLSHHAPYVHSMKDKAKNKFFLYPNGMSHIKDEDWQTYQKSKNLSIIASGKVGTEGYKVRNEIVDKCKGYLDLYGRGYNYIEYKLDGLKDYRFSYAIENSVVNLYFSEKILDCFSTGTVPIYYGCPAVMDLFNPDGIILLSTNNPVDMAVQIAELLSKDGESIYNEPKVQKAIRDNFETAKRYKVAEDIIYTDILKPRGLV